MPNPPKTTYFKGTVDVRNSSDTALYGFGNVLLENDVYMYGTGPRQLTADTATSLTLKTGTLLQAEASTVKIGKDDGTSNVLVQGSLTVTGTTQTVQSTNTLISDNLIVLNTEPSVNTSSSGLLFDRAVADVQADTVTHNTTLSANAAAGATSISISSVHDTGMSYAEAVVRINGETRTVVSHTAGATVLNLDTGIGGSYAAGQTVEIWATRRAAFVYNDADNVFEFIHTTATHTAKTLPRVAFASLRCKQILSETAGEGTVTVTLNAYDSTPVNISAAMKLRGVYRLMIESETSEEGAVAIFEITKGRAAQPHSTYFAVANMKSNTGEELDVQWPANSTPLLRHSVVKTGATAPETVVYKVRYLTV